MNAFVELFGKNPTPKEVQDWLGKVRWASVLHYWSTGYIDENDECKEFSTTTRCNLPSVRTKEDEEKFIETLKSIDYNDGFGTQELFGNIVFNDFTWLERREYDGSEWWEHEIMPIEPDWAKMQEED